MKAIIRKVELKKITTTEGKKFDRIEITCDVFVDEKNVRSRRASMSVDYAKKYFAHCGLSSADLPGKLCEVTLRKRSFTDKTTGELRVMEEIRYLNMLDENGEPIILRPEADKDMPF